MSLLQLRNLTVMRGACPVVEDVSFAVKPHDFVGLLGPNGAGKTTLLRAGLGLLPHQGRSSLADLPERARARAVAWLPQNREIAWPVDVHRLVALGRLPHLPRGQTPREVDRRAIADALGRMDLAAYARRSASALSGGEQARVLIARALAQDTPLLLADEPIAGLDPEHQLTAMQVFADLAREGRGVVAALHDLTLAARFCTRLILLHRGKVVADGAPAEVLTEDNVARVFRVRGRFEDGAAGRAFHVLEPVR